MTSTKLSIATKYMFETMRLSFEWTTYSCNFNIINYISFRPLQINITKIKITEVKAKFETLSLTNENFEKRFCKKIKCSK